MNTEYGAPFSAVDVILLPGILFLAAWLMRFLAWNQERGNRKGTGMKIAALVPVLLGLWIAGSYAYTMFNSSSGYLYMKSMEAMPKVRLAHFLAIALPVLTLIGFFAWHVVEKKLGRPISI